jgi:hypothetical protein
MPGICSADTSPLLYRINNQLTLLQHLFDHVYVHDGMCVGGWGMCRLNKKRPQGFKPLWSFCVLGSF